MDDVINPALPTALSVITGPLKRLIPDAKSTWTISLRCSLAALCLTMKLPCDALKRNIITLFFSHLAGTWRHPDVILTSSDVILHLYRYHSEVQAVVEGIPPKSGHDAFSPPTNHSLVKGLPYRHYSGRCRRSFRDVHDDPFRDHFMRRTVRVIMFTAVLVALFPGSPTTRKKFETKFYHLGDRHDTSSKKQAHRPT